MLPQEGTRQALAERRAPTGIFSHAWRVGRPSPQGCGCQAQDASAAVAGSQPFVPPKTDTLAQGDREVAQLRGISPAVSQENHAGQLLRT